MPTSPSLPDPFHITPATERDLGLVLMFIRELAEYERLADQAVATEADLRENLFGPERVAHAIIARVGGDAVGFALYFFNFSTFLGRPGLYLEDLFVRPAWRTRGIGRALLGHLAAIAVNRRCGRMEWTALNWNELALDFYRGIGATPMSDWLLLRLTGDPLAALAAAAPAIPPPSTL